MDVPLRLRLAYANFSGDVYCDRKNLGCIDQPLSCGLPFTSKGNQREGHYWLSSLVASLESKQSEGVLWNAAPAVNDSLSCTPLATALVGPREPSPSYSTDPTLQHLPDYREVADRTPPLVKDTCTTPRSPGAESPQNEAQIETPHDPPPSLIKTAASPPVSPLEPRKQEREIVEAVVRGDAVAEEETEDVKGVREVHVLEEISGTQETLYADVTAALERRLRECVFKAAAIDHAQQQLICTFQLQQPTPPVPSSLFPHSPPLKPSAVASSPQYQPSKQVVSTQTNASTFTKSEKNTATSDVAVVSSEAPGMNVCATDAGAPLPSLVANQTDVSLSSEVRKEMALHLYALRHQVQQMRDRLEAHESTHYRHMNALRAAFGQRRTSSSPPLRVDIVKAYEDDPVPYRKGPWREADFAAARRGGPARSASAAKGEPRSEVGYTSDDFTEVTSAASSVVSTEKSSSVSSTEDLFRQRQAAALRIRNQSASAAHSSATNVASSMRRLINGQSLDHSISMTNTITTTDTDSSSTRTTPSTMSNDNDTDSDA